MGVLHRGALYLLWLCGWDKFQLIIMHKYV